MALRAIWQFTDSPVHKLHIARKYTFYLLYYTKDMDLKDFGFNTLSNYFIYQQM